MVVLGGIEGVNIAHKISLIMRHQLNNNRQLR